jgi:hypothetical protein
VGAGVRTGFPRRLPGLTYETYETRETGETRETDLRLETLESGETGETIYKSFIINTYI